MSTYPSSELLRRKRLQREHDLAQFVQTEQAILIHGSPQPIKSTPCSVIIQTDLPKSKSTHQSTQTTPSTQSKPTKPRAPSPCKCGFSNRVFSLEKEKSQLAQELDNFKSRSQAAETEVSSLKATISRLRRRITILEDERNDLKDTIASNVLSAPTVALTPSTLPSSSTQLSSQEEVLTFPEDDDLDGYKIRHEPYDFEVLTEERNYGEKVEKLYNSGRRVSIFTNGTIKEVLPSGTCTILFKNKDVKRTFSDGKVIYKYTDVGTIHTTMADGVQIYEFANGQKEIHTADQKEILFADGTVKVVKSNGEEESTFPDGTVQTVDSRGRRSILFTNGQKEIHDPTGRKQRVYPDGTIKKVDVDGSITTEYPNGRIKVKDCHGRLISDSLG
ncbi:hypothetical protein P9112_000769 [Eukaryota sp. TZLM1-RC]